MTLPNIKLKLVSPPNVQVKLLPRYPVRMQGDGGIVVTTANGIATVEPDVGDLNPVEVLENGTDLYFWSYSATMGYARFSAQAIVNYLGVGYQPLDPTLTALAGVTTAADQLIYATGTDAFATAPFTSYGRSIVAAESAEDIGGLATVATSGNYDDLTNLPTLGTAAAADTTDFATSAQGALADSAVQPGDLGALALLDTVSVSDISATGTPSSATYLRGDNTWATPAGGGGGDVTTEQLEAVVFDNRVQAIYLAEAMGDVLFLGPDGSALHDGFDVLNYVDVANATNLSTTEAGVLQPVSETTLITGGTNIGDYTGSGGLAAAFDGNTDQSATTGALKPLTASGYGNTIGKNWGTGKVVTRFRVYGTNNGALLGAGGASTIKLQGSNDGSSWDDLYTTGTVGAAAGWSVDVTSGITSGTYSYHRINVNGNGTNGSSVAEVQFFEGGPGNLSVSSETITAAEQPDWIRVALRMEDSEGVVLNTDVFVDVSRDDGANWETATLVEAYTQPGDIRVLDTGKVSVSGQPAGESLKWRIRTDNLAMPKFHGIALWAGADA